VDIEEIDPGWFSIGLIGHLIFAGFGWCSKNVFLKKLYYVKEQDSYLGLLSSERLEKGLAPLKTFLFSSL